ncbi:hypothetical protein A6395_15345 [Exiguobacterium sp. SH31]|uniref:hypothetical protein n=1 Tax=Exiguobacterium sp. SH31 TaxID=1843183 RepID=UPI0008B52D74|nr:hypothetical protein [Exiguobacterium sp. SH31]OGX77812.1 hypothetical protein A6395_15345 [Exiguobacterium sp. SH31]
MNTTDEEKIVPRKRRAPLWFVIPVTVSITLLGIYTLRNLNETDNPVEDIVSETEIATEESTDVEDVDNESIYSETDSSIVDVPFDPHILDDIIEREQNFRELYDPNVIYAPDDLLMLEARWIADDLEVHYVSANEYYSEKPTVEEYRLKFVDVTWELVNYYDDIYSTSTSSTNESVEVLTYDHLDKRLWLSERADFYQYAPND